MSKKKYLSVLSALTVIGCASGVSAPAALAEGSNDLVSSGGDRPYLEFRTDINGGIPRRTIIKVYANAGETIDLGSSAVGRGGGRINYRDPNGNAGSCGTTGLIANRAEEVAGPGDGTGGTFVPCKVTVSAGQNGIWEVDFVSPDVNSAANPPPTAGTANWTQANTGLVSAWDVTVRDSGGAPISGRVYANYYAFNIGGNGRSLSSKFYVLTKEGYQYSIDLNGTDPYGFIFFANRNGFYEESSGDSIFRSLQFVGPNPGQLPTGYGFQNPNNPDVSIYVTHKTFINPPDASLPGSANSPTGSTWLYSLPEPPPVPANFQFTGIEGTPGQAGTNPLGGTLSFDSTSQSAYSITIDLNENDVYGDGNDRTFVGRSVVGANSVFWDGLDGNGNPVVASTIPYKVKINQYAGEAHFPMIDAEQSPNGIVLQRLNNPPGPFNPSADPSFVYYDDRNSGGSGTDYTLCAGGETGADCYGGPPTPREALNGVSSSSGGAHEFTSNFGNRRGIDTWVYYPSRDVQLVGGIVIKEADLIVDKTVDLANANPGDTLTYTVTVTNDGPSDEPGITFQDSVPAFLSNVSWSCAVTSGTGSCGTASGTGNEINATLDLNNQAVATYTITADISNSASGSITNEATAIRNNDITDPDLSNNTDDAVTVINNVPPPIGAFCYLVANSNNTLVQVDINTGAEAVVASGITGGAIRAIAYQKNINTLYVANGNRLGAYNTLTNTYSNIGPFGSVNGTAASVDGLALHPFTRELYGSVRNTGGADLLIKIDPATGSRIANAFGPGIDFLTIQTTGSNDIGDIAFDPTTGDLFGIANRGNSNSDQLVRINVSNGSTSLVGNLGVNRVEGLSAFNDGSFYGSTGNATNPASERNRFYRISPTAGTANSIGNTLSAGLAYESVACATEDENRITGTVFLDPDTDGVLNLGAGDSGTPNAAIRLYRDFNGNGQVDGSDILLASQSSATAGTFDFIFAANGSFALNVDPTTLPPENSVFTTDNLEVASFGSSFGLTDSDNNFGHYTNSNLAIVKRITAINGTQLPDSVDDLSDDDDNHPNWPAGQSGAGVSTFLAGATETKVEPGDEVEYTIYYLATGNFPVTNVKLCDRVPDGTDYVPESMVLFTNSSTSNLTDTNIDSDGSEFLSAGNNAAVPCPGTNNNGTVLVNLAPSPNQLPNATGPGTPTDAFGFIRFRATVK